MAERAIIPISLTLGIFPALVYLFSHINVMVGATLLGILAVGWTLGSLLTYILSLRLFDRLWPWKKLVITAEFNGTFRKKPAKKHL
jgi:hypothetical protein